jgi:hypothetical protein
VSDKRLFTDDLAARLRKRAGEVYCPSNGTEGELFMQEWCYICEHYQGCAILPLTMLHDPGSKDYPREWQYGSDGQPKCTAFEEVKHG